MSNNDQPANLTNLHRKPSLLKWWRNGNLRFLLVAIAFAASLRWTMAWPPGGSMRIGPAPRELVWGVAYLLFPTLLTLFFAVWATKLLFQSVLRSKPAEHLSPQVGTIPPSAGAPDINQRASRLTAGLLIATALFLVSGWALRRIAHWGPGALIATSDVGSVLLAVLAIAFVAYATRKGVPSQPMTRGNLVALAGGILIIAAVGFALPGSRLGLTLALIATILFQIPYRLVHWTWGAVRCGQYQVALRRTRLCSWIPRYPKVLEAEILYEAGRYSEAKALLKGTAFDVNGAPKLGSPELCVYAKVAAAGGEIQEAERLLEAAMRVPQKIGATQMALAELLLECNKDLERATKLIEHVIETWKPKGPKSFQKWLISHRSAAHAWALALAGRRSEAKQELQTAFANLEPDANRDIAYVQFLAGEAHLAIGDMEGARKAFADAAERDPQGHHGKKARNKLQALT